MEATLKSLADLLGGRLMGDGTTAITSVGTLRDVVLGGLTFLDGEKHLPALEQSAAVAALVPESWADCPRPAIAVPDVHAAFAQVVTLFHPARLTRRPGISDRADVDPTAVIGPRTQIHPGAFVGPGVTIGADCVIHSGVRILAACEIGAQTTLFPNVVLYEGTILGQRVTIHGGAVIGAYGFGYGFEQGRHIRSAQLGNVEIGNDVEIGSNTTIDRGTYGPTTIGEGTKVDNLVMIAHNCRIGRHNLLCSQVGIAGSCTTGDYVVMAGQVGIRDHIVIGDRVRLGAQAGVMNDCEAGKTYFGAPARPEREQKEIFVTMFRLPEMRRELKQLRRQVAALLGVGKDDADTTVAENPSGVSAQPVETASTNRDAA